MKFSERLSTIDVSATLDITSKAKAMLASGEDVCILAAGEPDFDTPQVIKDAAIKAIRDGKTKYTPASGTKSLKEAICRKLYSDNLLKYDADEIVVSNGAKHSLYNVLQVICNVGDDVLIIPPYWLSYPEMVKLAGAHPRVVPSYIENQFKITPQDLLSSLTKNTRALIINSPSNPAGVVYNKDEFCQIAKICIENNITIISDEIYEKIIFGGEIHFSPASISKEVHDATILVNGVSKTYSMTGWRIGYAAGDRKIMGLLSVLQSHSTSNPCSISQAAAECALTADLGDVVEHARLEYEKRRDVLLEHLAGEDRIKPLKPEGAFYLFCDISACGMDSVNFSQKLLAEKKVAVVPGTPFGANQFIRISFAAGIDVIIEGAKRIKEFVNIC